ncbi:MULTISPECIES: FtsK/SpoIIIE domain-containing protein [unclassified Streptomyces]|uniref:FtsK/SpoIIIE domain-containing protein n=1 Tax=unclassified Streptomyces TaxID=2593676 RepID=UPI0013C69AFF|nr:MULTISPECIES: FtsK/SpoIIIE domain-containing protein [unclassified Streptomyces]MCZ4095687.1 FtsK/SpoIIIE domain-containing protein [Streptomyces sp. H39-C1]NEA72180.1 cell division protein FtsK [Streptomyces sp. SID13588]
MTPETATHYAPLLVALGLVVLLVLGIRIAVRYLRADTEMRASIRQAARIRRRWVRLALMLGLSVVDKKPTLVASMTAKDGQVPKPREKTPKISTVPDRFGVIVHANCLPNVGLEDFKNKAAYLADDWGCTRLSVRQNGPGKVIMRAVRTDPLIVPTTFIPSGLPLPDVSLWDLGVDEYAELVTLRVSNIPGITVAGLPGYGKTSLVNAIVCRLAPSGAVQIVVLDGKVSSADEGDYADMVKRFFAFAGDDLEEANRLLKRLVALRRERSSTIRRVLGVANMWHVGPSPEWPLVLVIIDEAHTYFRDHKGSDPKTKALAALAAENARLVEDLVKKGRSIGMVVILATQKATGDAIPTFIRDVCPVGLSFAQKTAEASVAALGEDIRNWPDANPVLLQDPGYVGVAAMVTQGQEGFIRVRMPEVDPYYAAQIAADTAHLTADPTDLLAVSLAAPPVMFKNHPRPRGSR